MTTTAITAGAPMGGGDGGADVTFGDPPQVNRLWGIPILGYIVRGLVLIPHFIVLWFAGIVLGLSLVIVWIPVLLMGRQPLAGFYKWYFGYTARLLAWMFFIAGPYPPIIGDDGSYPVQVRMEVDRPINRLWGILWFGMVVRYILLIPHYLVVLVLGIVAYFLMLVAWIFILINGRVPGVMHSVFTRLIRQSTRIGLWLYLCPTSYPPFVP